jgi:hypothetical protein
MLGCGVAALLLVLGDQAQSLDGPALDAMAAR